MKFNKYLFIIFTLFASAIMSLLVVLIGSVLFWRNIRATPLCCPGDPKVLVTPIPELKSQGKLPRVKEEIEAQNVLRKIRPVVVAFYQKKKNSSLQILENIYGEDEFLGNGTILTNDGWIIAGNSLFDTVKRDSIIMVYNNQTYTLKEIIKDKIGGVSFIKVEAQDLPVIEFGSFEDLFSGQTVFAINYFEDLMSAKIANTHYSPSKLSVLSSEKFSEFIILDKALPYRFQGAPISDLDGRIIGLIFFQDEYQYLISVDNFRTVIVGVLKEKIIHRPYLGIQYLDVVKTVTENSQRVRDAIGSRGLYIIQNPPANSPAFIGGIRAGDIILKVDNRVVGSQKDFTRFVMEYSVGDVLNMLVLRKNKEIEFKLKLGEIR